MITEDYVSFEVAKMLKEKGFNSPCMGRYSVRSKEFHLDCTKMCNNGGLFECAAPTHQMAMKWLRLKHNIYIDVHLSFAEDTEVYPAVYYVYILDAKSGNSLLENAVHIGELNPLMDISDHNVPINFDSPEEAVEAALKYTLENLI